MKDVKENGNVYRLSSRLNPFQTKMQIHLINWKWKNITKEPGISIYKNESYEYDAILPESVISNYPLIYPSILSELINHKKVYDFKFHKYFNHIASSQAANINLFLPILLHEKTAEILKAIKPDIKRLASDKLYKGFQIEFWDNQTNGNKGTLKDKTKAAGTDSDIGIAYYNNNDELCLWLIEHKLTEAEFTTCGGAVSKGKKTTHNCSKSVSEIIANKDFCYYHQVKEYEYWNITEKNLSFFTNHTNHKECPFKKGMNQLWRNQLMGLALENEKKYTNVYFSVVKHKDNDSLDKTIKEYKNLINDNPKFSVFTSNELIALASKLDDSSLKDWIEWYNELYIV